jgi:hypothetical protein
MNTQVLVKEGRPLFWPWCAVMLTVLVSLIRPLHSIEWVGLLGVVLGVPLLATLPFGNEFQNRTLSLLLSQPVGRGRIWIEKTSVAFVAVASVVLLFACSPWATQALPDRAQQAYAAALVIAVLASATFWTLIARSTIGGIALGLGSVIIVAGFSSVAAGLGTNSLLVMTHFTAIKIIPLFAYAGLMLWLGGRTLARYQVTGSMAGDDLLTTGSNVILGAFSGGACASPTRPVLNLIRKELRLLRPVWLITALTASTWACLAVANLSHHSKTLSLLVIAFGLASAAIIAILAGCLSLGEEKISGTHAWHRTLPISAARLWWVKLCVALVVSFVCAGLVPAALLTTGEHLFPLVFSHLPSNFQPLWLSAVVFVTLLSFWYACAVNGTVTAVACVVPTLAIFLATPAIANWAGRALADFVAARSNLFGNFRVAAFLSGLGNRHVDAMINFINPAAPSATQFIFWIPTLILAVIQSYRLFKAPIRNGAFPAARKLSPLVVLALLCGASTYAFVWLSNAAGSRVWGTTFAVDRAIQSVLSNSPNREAPQPLQLSADDLKKAYPPHVLTSPYLEGATVTVLPDKAHPTTCCSQYAPGRWVIWNYTATVHLATGAEMNFSLEPSAQEPVGVRTGVPRFEVRVRWPGSGPQQTLIAR